MTTARTHRRNVGRGGAARPRDPQPTPEGFTPVSAETFAVTGFSVGAEAAFDPSGLDFDPADHTTDEVKQYVEDHPETVDAILELELNGKGRSGLISFLDNLNTEPED